MTTAIWTGYDVADEVPAFPVTTATPPPDELDWIDVRIEPALRVRCTEHGTIGYTSDRGEAKQLRDRHAVERHGGVR